MSAPDGEAAVIRYAPPAVDVDHVVDASRLGSWPALAKKDGGTREQV